MPLPLCEDLLIPLYEDLLIPLYKDLLIPALKELLVANCKEALRALHRYLSEHSTRYINLVKDTVQRGLQWGLEKLKQIKNILVAKCQENKELMESLGIKYGLKVITKLGTEYVATKCLNKAAEKVVKLTIKKAAMEGVETAAKETTRVVVKISVTAAVKQSAKFAKAAAGPIGWTADAIQVAGEVSGKKEAVIAGKIVGATGNVAAGALYGLALGGPFGAVIGGAGGGLLWAGGEAAGPLFDYIMF